MARFLVMIKADATSEAGGAPSEEIIKAMGDYNQKLIDAGVMLSGEGLYPSSQGARVYGSKNGVRVVDGPFAEAKELVAGFWMWQCDSLADAVEWVKQAPQPTDDTEVQIEVRQIFEFEDFAEQMSPEAVEQEERQREQLAERNG